jgi:hypothetical protein
LRLSNNSISKKTLPSSRDFCNNEAAFLKERSSGLRCLRELFSEHGEREGEDFDELSRVAPSGSASGGGDASPYK